MFFVRKEDLSREAKEGTGDEIPKRFPRRRMFDYEKKMPTRAVLKNVSFGVIMDVTSPVKGGTGMIRYVIAA
ncbi:MAG: hypothetical protein IJ418_08335 [Clostridia bacterium]|nr:hypothetical protein [Clostridia bacterium]